MSAGRKSKRHVKGGEVMTFGTNRALFASGWLAAGLWCLLQGSGNAAAAEKGQWVRLAPKTPSQPDATDLNKVLPSGCPSAVRGALAVDHLTGNVFISSCYYGVWKSTDQGQTFARIDKGQIHDGSPFKEFSLQIDPEDSKKMAVFHANANPINYTYAYAFLSQKALIPTATCGLSTDGGSTWQIFAPVNTGDHRNPMDLIFDKLFVIDWKSLTVVAEHGPLYYGSNAGKDWQMINKRASYGFNGLGILDAQVIVVSKSNIERSEDGGKTWTKVSDYIGVGPVQVFKGVAFWATNKSEIITSKDLGKTWTAFASSPKEIAQPNFFAKCGPYFGKDEKHLVVAGKEGFSETTDGGATWKLAAPLPPPAADVMPRGGVAPTAGFDPVNNIIYYLPTDGYLEDIWKFER